MGQKILVPCSYFKWCGILLSWVMDQMEVEALMLKGQVFKLKIQKSLFEKHQIRVEKLFS